MQAALKQFAAAVDASVAAGQKRQVAGQAAAGGYTIGEHLSTVLQQVCNVMEAMLLCTGRCCLLSWLHGLVAPNSCGSAMCFLSCKRSQSLPHTATLHIPASAHSAATSQSDTPDALYHEAPASE